MKILMLIDRLSVGGAESHVLTLSRELVRRGHTVHIFAERGAWTRQAERAGIVCHTPPAPLTGRDFFATALRNAGYLRRLSYQESYDILHAHTRRTAFLLRLLKKCPSSARVVTCHARFSPRYRRLCYWGEETVAVSEDLRAHLEAVFSLPQDRVRVIPNGIDGTRFSPGGREDTGNTVRITFASRLDEDCAGAARLLLSLCEGWREVLLARGQRLSLTVIGGGEAYEEVRRAAGRLNRKVGEEVVCVVGAVDDPAPYLKRTDLFVGVSRAALEALFCGATVLLAGDEGMAGLLTPDNFDRLAQGNFCCREENKLSGDGLNAAFFAFLKQHPQKRADDSAVLRAAAAERFGAVRMGQATEALYASVLAAHRPKNVLLAGYAGCGNLGDDAIARRLIADIEAQNTQARVAVTVKDPCDPRHRFGNARLIERRSPLSLLRALRRSDALWLGGGCLLQNCSKHGGRSLLYYLAFASLARLCHRPVFWVAAGIGPLQGRMARRLVGRTLRRAAHISVRDAASRQTAILLGVPPARIRRRADPVLSLIPAPPYKAKAFLQAHLPKGARSGRYLCVAPRPGCTDESALASALVQLYRNEGIYPLFLAFDRTEDTPVCDRLMAACGVGVRLPCEDEALIASLFSLDTVVGVAAGRLHALILSHVAGKAAVALCGDGRDGKVAGFAQSVGSGILVHSATAKETYTALSGLFNRQDE